jgi:guanine nucleotide-binding protein G(i) subunit alpha
MEEQKEDENLVTMKWVMLGTGECGKSTIFRQLKQTFGEGYSSEKRKSFRMVIDANIIQGMQTLIKYSDRLALQFGTKISEELMNSKNFMNGLDEEAKLDENIANHISKLWKDPAIRITFEHSNLFHMPAHESAEYFFNRVLDIAQSGYIPSFEDILRCKARTSGIQTVEFIHGHHNVKLLDTGGQRNERKKWKKAFPGTDVILFVAAISEYDQTLFEDGKTNRLHETLKLFSEVCKSKLLAGTPIVLFLNKTDFFAQKIKKVDLRVCFPDYTGENEYIPGLDFVASKFKEVYEGRTHELQIRVVNALESEQVVSSFEASKETIIMRNVGEKGRLLLESPNKTITN